ncbi:MAG: 4-hydroxy-3-methylbut-2-enyl diphosphate reductase [Planctomycetes bacterium]|nr:4-hydroxy-3-methylbut-2-enyl diphosphate reductase [Planctomycetota bacterium]
MKIILAETAGFCMGVRRAMEIAVDASRNAPKPVYTYGPIIHNAQAIELLNTRGVGVVDADSIPESGTVIIRAHGIPPEEKAMLEGRGLTVIDATCPHVILSQKRIAQESTAGRVIVIVGDREHPEVKSLAGFSKTAVTIISSIPEAEAFRSESPFSVVGQTTFNQDSYDRIGLILKRENHDVKLFDSICNATEQRQTETRRIAEEVDVMVIVGGKNSANTQRLAQISRNAGKPAFHVETADELRKENFVGVKRVGVTAGASTPGWVTQHVIASIQSFSPNTPVDILKKLLSFCARSRITTALGASAIAFAVQILTQVAETQISVIAIPSLFMFFAYTLNRKEPSGKYTRELAVIDSFYQSHRLLLLTPGVLSIIAALYLSLTINQSAFLLILGASIISFLYSAPIFLGTAKYNRIKDIPASKDIFVAAAWGIVIPGLISCSDSNVDFVPILISAICVFLISFAKRATLDLRDIESDHLIGYETLPIIMGRKRAIVLLYCLYLAALIILVGSAALDLVGDFGYILAALPLCGMITLSQLIRSRFKGEVACQLVLDGQMWLGGLLALCWRVV